MTKIRIEIEFEGPTDPEELFSSIEEALVQFRYKGLIFATTGEDQPIMVTDWNTEWKPEELEWGNEDHAEKWQEIVDKVIEAEKETK
jgi:hypothetical protein